jgi:hypothetical protein
MMTLGVILTCITGASCASRDGATTTPILQVPARALLIDATAFPERWEADPCVPDCARLEGEQQAIRVFGIVGVAGHVNQKVHRFDTVQAAVAYYQRAHEVDFRVRQAPQHQLTPPVDIPYQSPIADEYYLGCGVDELPVCRAIMRYHNYVVMLFFIIDNGDGEGVQ